MQEFSVVIITFNSKNFISPCLDSIFTQGHQFQVVVVDNGSKDGTAGLIKKNYPQVTLIENKDNLGACKARNQGIDVSRGEWILCLDCDIILEKDFIEKMIAAVKNSTDSIGMVQPKILRYDKKSIYSCGIYLSAIRRFYDIGKGEFDKGQFDKMGHIFGACSAAALYKRDMLEEIKGQSGYFNERFFFLVEDVDLSWRAQKKGWKTLFSPRAVCYHAGNSSGSSRKLRQYLCFRNRLLSISKNENLIGKIGLLPVFIVYDLPRLLFLLLRC